MSNLSNDRFPCRFPANRPAGKIFSLPNASVFAYAGDYDRFFWRSRFFSLLFPCGRENGTENRWAAKPPKSRNKPAIAFVPG
jgi:hypothetical protein